jgi:ribosomal protein S18 acetylase RimI-like enzyme
MEINLTVEQKNKAAVGLYKSAGFISERVLVGYRMKTGRNSR